MTKLCLVPLLFLTLSCTPDTKKDVPTVEVTVETNALGDNSRVISAYELKHNDCNVRWQTISTKEEKGLNVHLQNRTICYLPFQEVANSHEAVLQRIQKDYSASTIKSISTGGLRTLQSDGAWNDIVGKAAAESPEYQDFRKNYPNHKSKLSSNEIFVKLLKSTQAHAPFKEMLKKAGLNFEVEGVEKVFNDKDENGKTIINDAGIIWWKTN